MFWAENRFWAELKKALGWSKNVLGWTKKGFGAEKKKVNTSTRKEGGAKGKRIKQKNKKKKKGGAGKENKKREVLTRRRKEERGAEAERKRGLEQRKVRRWSWTERAEQIIFQHLFSFKSFQKNDGEFVYVEFDF